MSLILYHCNTSYASHKARLYLAEKQIPWESHHIDLRKQEHITSNYREINPQGTVPALQDGETIICGSTALMVYLEEKFPTPCLLSLSEPTHQQQLDFCYRHEALHDPSLRLLSYVNVFMNEEKRKKMNVQRVLNFAEQHPWKQRGEFLKRVLNGEVQEAEITAAKTEINKALLNLQELLSESSGPFLFGKNYSIADAVATASLFRIKAVGLSNALEQLGEVEIYYQQMQQRKSFKEAKLI